MMVFERELRVQPDTQPPCRLFVEWDGVASDIHRCRGGGDSFSFGRWLPQSYSPMSGAVRQSWIFSPLPIWEAGHEIRELGRREGGGA